MSYSRKGKKEAHAKTVSDNWTEQEVKQLLKNIYAYGHCDFKRILINIPHKNKLQVKTFLRKLSSIARSERGVPPEQIFNFNNWIKAVELESSSNNTISPNGPLELAIILKMLSLDGVLENHPLPSDASAVDFGACYRVLYQALLGHPIQPVNKKTLDVLMDCFMDVNRLVNGNPTVVENLQKKLNQDPDDPLKSLYTRSVIKNSEASNSTPLLPKSDNVKDNEGDIKQKTVKTYSRKPKSDPSNSNIKDKLLPEPKQVSIIVKSLPLNQESAACSLQISLDLPTRMDSLLLKQEETEVLEDVTYNPFKLPPEWLKNTSLNIKYNLPNIKNSSYNKGNSSEIGGILFSDNHL